MFTWEFEDDRRIHMTEVPIKSNGKRKPNEPLKRTFRNFAGEASALNQNGRRYINIDIPDDLADALVEKGVNVKRGNPNPNDPDDKGKCFIKVYLNYRKNDDDRNPVVMVNTGRVCREFKPHELQDLDFMFIKHASEMTIALSPYETPFGDKGMSIYLNGCELVTGGSASETSNYYRSKARTENCDESNDEEYIPFN